MFIRAEYGGLNDEHESARVIVRGIIFFSYLTEV